MYQSRWASVYGVHCVSYFGLFLNWLFCKEVRSESNLSSIGVNFIFGYIFVGVGSSSSSRVTLFKDRMANMYAQRSTSYAKLILGTFHGCRLFKFSVRPILSVVNPSLRAKDQSIMELGSGAIRVLYHAQIRPVSETIRVGRFIQSRRLTRNLRGRSFFLFVVVT